MSADNIAVEADRQQVATLCDALDARTASAQGEAALLTQLVRMTEDVRPTQSRHYQALLEASRLNYQRMRDVVSRFCRVR